MIKAKTLDKVAQKQIQEEIPTQILEQTQVVEL
jgi:hypothetical protein